ncbi:AI-2E family transporter [Pseudomonas sp. S2_F03]
MTSRPTIEVDSLLKANLDALLGSVVDEDQRSLQPLERPCSERQVQKDQRLQELLSRCREEALQQIVGPFGLTPAMFSDIKGGNVTTQHNASQDLYAKESERYNRKEDYDYATAKRQKLKEAFESGQMNSQTFTNTYTGETAPTKRVAENGKLKMNAELDHTIPLKQAHKEGAWMVSQNRRKKLASEKDNLNFTTFENNRAKSDTAAEEALSAHNGYDESVTQPIIDKARESIDAHLPGTGERVLYHGKELGVTGAKEFGKTGVRRAMGVLLFELVNGAFVEVHKVVSQRDSEETLLNRVVAAIERVLKRVQGKFKDAFTAFFEGGLQGFVSNLLTFLINNLITTSAKVVTIIREGVQKLLEALKVLLWPPEGLPTSEVMRAVTKSFAGLFTMGAGMLWEQSINAFILSIPILAPIAGMISPVITGLMTGLATALLMYGIDSLIDWMLDKGTDFFNAQINALEGSAELVQRMIDQVEAQFQISQRYREMARVNEQIAGQFHQAERAARASVAHAQATVQDQDATLAALSQSIEAKKKLNERLGSLLKQYTKET